MRLVLNRPAPRLFGASIALLLTVVAAAACGDAEDDAQVQAFEQLGGPDLTERTFFPTVTDAMVAAGTFRAELSIVSGPQHVDMLGEQRVDASGDSDFRIETTLDDARSTVIKTGDVAYLTNDSLDDLFVRIDLNDTSDPAAEQFASELDQGTLEQQLSGLDGAVDTVRRIGTSPASDGDLSAEYEVRIDVADMDTENGKTLRAAGFREVDYTFLVDEERRIRQMTVDMPVMRLRYVLSHWGEPVDVAAPDPDELSGLTASDVFGTRDS